MAVGVAELAGACCISQIAWAVLCSNFVTRLFLKHTYTWLAQRLKYIYWISTVKLSKQRSTNWLAESIRWVHLMWVLYIYSCALLITTARMCRISCLCSTNIFVKENPFCDLFKTNWLNHNGWTAYFRISHSISTCIIFDGTWEVQSVDDLV